MAYQSDHPSSAVRMPREGADNKRKGIIRIPDEDEGSSALPIEALLIPPQYRGCLKSVIISYGLISDRINKLAHDINEDYHGETVHILCVLKGGSSFFHELVHALISLASNARSELARTRPLPPQFTFDHIRVKSYKGMESTGNVEISGTDVANLKGRHLLVVEDLIDSGLSMSKLVPHLQEFGQPASLRVAALMEKRTPKSCGFQADYTAFSIPNANYTVFYGRFERLFLSIFNLTCPQITQSFVVGYSLDYNEAFRDMLHICIINEEGIRRFSTPEATKKLTGEVM